jgi:hypothetical protein
VQRQRHARRIEEERAAIDGDTLALRISALTERRDAAVDGDTPIDDQRLDTAPAAEAGTREELLQALAGDLRGIRRTIGAQRRRRRSMTVSSVIITRAVPGSCSITRATSNGGATEIEGAIDGRAGLDGVTARERWVASGPAALARTRPRSRRARSARSTDLAARPTATAPAARAILARCHERTVSATWRRAGTRPTAGCGISARLAGIASDVA